MIRLNKSYPYMKQLKNRSSKDNKILVGPGTKPIMRCVSGFQLKQWAAQEVRGAEGELKRRKEKHAKKEGKEVK